MGASRPGFFVIRCYFFCATIARSTCAKKKKSFVPYIRRRPQKEKEREKKKESKKNKPKEIGPNIGHGPPQVPSPMCVNVVRFLQPRARMGSLPRHGKRHSSSPMAEPRPSEATASWDPGAVASVHGMYNKYV